jgi:uncharacterized RDD family membrane protein YckC
LSRVGFWRRAIAGGIDAALVLLVLLPGDAARRWLIVSGDLGPVAARAFAAGEHLFVLGYFLFEVAVATSLGKFILRLEIANVDGGEATVATLLNRWTAKWSFLLVAVLFDVFQNVLLWWLASLLFWIVVIGCLAAAGDLKLAWHDQWAHTAVFRAKARTKRSGFEVVRSPTDRK